MQPDPGQGQFDSRHRQDDPAMQAVLGVRWVLLSLLAYLGEIAWVTLALLASDSGAAPGVALQATLWAVSLAAFACGAWGTLRLVDAMDWGRLAAFGLIATFLLPYFRLLALMAVALIGFDFIQARGFRFSLWGPPPRRTAPSGADPGPLP